MQGAGRRTRTAAAPSLTVAGVLASLGLSQYAAAVHDLGVDDVDDFQHLDPAEDLDDLGMKKIHRRKFVARLKELARERGWNGWQ